MIRSSVPALWTVIDDDFVFEDLSCPPIEEDFGKETKVAEETAITVESDKIMTES